ncbi:MAG: flagellar transcriptional regulator FlhC [Pseudomonadota bacterium]|nr:flagellar transcriptional regulator FlhC [Pseudomonadota bacterium]
MRGKSVVEDVREVARATSLIELGARLQVLEAETCLSRERLLRLYKELKGKSPPKGMLPFSTDWFVTWMPNIHSSLFMAIYQHLIKSADIDDIDAIIKGYRLYVEQCTTHELAVDLSITRAWRLVKFFNAGMLRLAKCTCCRGQFVVREFDLTRNYVCGLCHMPSRAGKTRAAAAA